MQGKIDAEENVQVNPEAPGVVTAVFATIGQNVVKGQVLAQIDDQVLRQNISELQNQLELATTLFERQKNLWNHFQKSIDREKVQSLPTRSFLRQQFQ